MINFLVIIIYTEILISSLALNGYHPDDITDVFLTHLHFDHCGGGVKYNEKGELVTVFKNATYWSNELHWNLAMNLMMRACIIFKRKFGTNESFGSADFIKNDRIFLPGFDVLFAHGHTESQMIPHIKYKGNTIVFAVIVPSVGHMPLPYVMGYDTRINHFKREESF